MNSGFCQDNFWNWSLFNQKDKPRFTNCFQYSLLIISSSLLLIPFLIFLVFKLYRYSTPIYRINVDFSYCFKLGLQVLLVIGLIIEILLDILSIPKDFLQLDKLYGISYAVLGTSVICAIWLTEIRRRTLHPMCPLLFTFWLLSTLTYLVRFYSNILRITAVNLTTGGVALFFFTALNFGLFALSFVIECFSRHTLQNTVINKRIPCPEEYCSILSKFTYFWLDWFIYKSFKIEMTEQTAFDLRREDETTRTTDLLDETFRRMVLKKKKQIKHQKKRSTRNAKEKHATELQYLLHKDNNDKIQDETEDLSPGWMLFSCLAKIYYPTFLMGLGFKLVSDVMVFSQPFLLKILLHYMSDKTSYAWQGYCLALTFLLSAVLSSLFDNFCSFVLWNMSIQVRGNLIGLIYRKALKVNNEARNEYASGEVLNLMSVDTERMQTCIMYSWSLMSSPLQIMLATVFLYYEVSYSILAGLGVIILFFAINWFLMNFYEKFTVVELEWKDKRMNTLAEIFKGIKVLKMYAWEPSFISKVKELRNHEMRYIRNLSIAWNLFNVCWENLSFTLMLVTFVTFVYSDISHILTAERAFVSLALFNLIQYPMYVLPYGIAQSTNGAVSLKRMGKYFVQDDIDLTGIHFLEDNGKKSNEDVVVEITDGSFAWKNDDKIILNNVNVEITRGKLVVIVGRVGTGKSSLLSAMLGEMVRKKGNVRIKGTVGFVPQEAWIQNTTLKKNVLFTNKFDEKFYRKVVESCALIPDFDQLPAGDETEIGERGINLSGGQKQRVNLARAVYQNSDIYLLDDPLSAVDAHVGNHLFENVLSNKGILKNKTRILVTHGVHWLPRADEVIVLNSEGTISERGSFRDLMNDGKEFQKFVEEHMEHISKIKSPMDLGLSITMKTKDSLRQISESEDDIFSDDQLSSLPQQLLSCPFEDDLERVKRSKHSSATEIRVRNRRLSSHSSTTLSLSGRDRTISITQIESMGQLTDEEIAMSGNVSWRTYVAYFNAWLPPVVFITITLYACFAAIQVYGNFWLEQYSSDPVLLNASILIKQSRSYIKPLSETIRSRTDYYMKYYAIIGAGEFIVICAYFAGLTFGCVRASRILLEEMLNRIMRCPMSFFDTTPSGRILNRFSRDMDLIDHSLPFSVTEMFGCTMTFASCLVVVAIVTPWFAIVIVPSAIILYFIQKLYIPTSRQSRRLDSIASSPLFNNFAETLQGTSIIRAFKEQDHFETLNQELVDQTSRFKFIQNAATRWLTLRLETLGNTLVFAAVFFCIIKRESLTPSLVGLTVSYALQITKYLNWVLHRYSELEVNTVAVERVRDYSMVPSEAPWITDVVVPQNWPDRGTIVFENYNLRYRDGLPLVLKNIQLHIEGGLKVGVVGRTGAGKSSLNTAIFRLMEAASGCLKIDNLNVSEIGLHDLRERLTILPQDPVIFSGTIRENLDPFNRYDEKDLYECLEKAHLKNWVNEQSEALEYECGESGANLSVGQKQLLCLARALLRKSKIVILDEATASVDVETDRLVMQSIREYFATSSVIIIAHRINTILDCDRVLVLDNGEVAEFDTPQNLLNNPNSLFKSLADQCAENDL